MHQVLLYLLRSSKPLVPEEEIADMLQWEELEWQKYAEECKGMIVTNPGMVGVLQKHRLPIDLHTSICPTIHPSIRWLHAACLYCRCVCKSTTFRM